MTMNRYVALLRGINVGGNKKVPMAELKSFFEAIGYENVTTYINSGNVIFDTDHSDFTNLSDALSKHFGFEIDLVIIEKSIILAIEDECPGDWTNDKDQKTDVLFLWEGYNSAKTLEELNLVPDIDTAFYTSGAIVWNIKREKQHKSRMQKGFVGSGIYKNMTARNINTVRKLAELVNQ